MKKGAQSALDLHYKECSVAITKAKKQALELVYPEPKKAKNPKEPVVCSICAKTFTRQTMNSHMYRHRLEENPLRCPYSMCKTSFENAGSTKLHISKRHMRKHQLYCESCGSVYSDKERLRAHIMSAHKKLSLDVKCTECDDGKQPVQPDAVHEVLMELHPRLCGAVGGRSVVGVGVFLGTDSCMFAVC